jgi:omega-6 fatty acid desaturase (delta-12 desaturase)
VTPYQHADVRRSVGQLADSVLPYLALWAVMIYTWNISYWLTLPLIVLAAGFLVRVFIIFHDCGHGAFFKSQRANDVVGVITGVLTFTPYYHWRHHHALHHATAGNLDRRGIGDVWTMTVAEYQAASRWRRFAYRFFRFPLVTFLIGPIFMFVIAQRFPTEPAGRREKLSVHATNLALAGIVALAVFAIGWRAYLAIQLPIMLVAGAAGVWLFYVQHQFDGTYWARQPNWDFAKAALQGSSLYKLPRVLQWFSGNIGFHHIHHLSPRIPNYFLQRCYEENPILQQVRPLTLLASLRSLRLHLWDEAQGQLVGFGRFKAAPAAR